MRTASEKLAIIRRVEESELLIHRTLSEIKVSRSSFYRWYAAYEQDGIAGLENQGSTSRRHWNRIPGSVRAGVVAIALERPDLTPRGLAYRSRYGTHSWCAISPADPGQDREVSPLDEERHQAGTFLLPDIISYYVWLYYQCNLGPHLVRGSLRGSL